MSFEQRLLKFFRTLILVGAIVTGVVLWIVQWSMTRPQTQPIAFSHQVHVGQRQISCFYCHTGAMKGDIAGVIAVQDCMQCHQTVAADHPEIQKISERWFKTKQPIVWAKVYKMPKHVHFSHRVHIAFLSRNNPDALADPGKTICIKCHGDVPNMKVIGAPVSLPMVLTGNMNPNTGMGFCVDCHRANGGPMDCTACHR